jgi:acetyl-CoA C-acetyltransferase
LFTSLNEAKERNLKPLVRVVSWSQYGCEPMLMGVAPIQAIQNAVNISYLIFLNVLEY